MATLNTAYHAHYDSPKFFHQMIPKTVQQFNKLVYPAFIAAGIINCLIMSTGFLTFGGTSQGLILNNYATSDNLAIWGRLAITASILFGCDHRFCSSSFMLMYMSQVSACLQRIPHWSLRTCGSQESLPVR
eukprot:754187-Hanusia_phi.AAC.3